MKRTTMGFGKIGMNLGALKLADKKVEDPPNDDKGGGETENGGFGKISASPAASKSTLNVPKDNAQVLWLLYIIGTGISRKEKLCKKFFKCVYLSFHNYKIVF